MKITDSINRIALLFIGLLLTGLGAYGLLRGVGAMGPESSDGVVVTPGISGFVARNSEWFWPLLAVAGLALAYLGWRWLLAQFPAPQQVHNFDLASKGPGSTRIRARAAAQAWAKDVGKLDAVGSSRAWFQQGASGPRAEMRLTVLDNGDLGAVRSQVEGETLDRLRLSLDMKALEAHVVVRLRESSERFLK
ncbi:MAG: hypothetical protein M3454_06280 [Actinomycetota bacterium]|nr:hypothetical protein [Actinomycetota bacterium]